MRSVDERAQQVGLDPREIGSARLLEAYVQRLRRAVAPPQQSVDDLVRSLPRHGTLDGLLWIRYAPGCSNNCALLADPRREGRALLHVLQHSPCSRATVLRRHLVVMEVVVRPPRGHGRPMRSTCLPRFSRRALSSPSWAICGRRGRCPAKSASSNGLCWPAWTARASGGRWRSREKAMADSTLGSCNDCRLSAMRLTLGKQTCKIPGWTLKLARTRELSMLFAL